MHALLLFLGSSETGLGTCMLHKPFTTKLHSHPINISTIHYMLIYAMYNMYVKYKVGNIVNHIAYIIDSIYTL